MHMADIYHRNETHLVTSWKPLLSGKMNDVGKINSVFKGLILQRMCSRLMEFPGSRRMNVFPSLHPHVIRRSNSFVEMHWEIGCLLEMTKFQLRTMISWLNNEKFDIFSASYLTGISF